MKTKKLISIILAISIVLVMIPAWGMSASALVYEDGDDTYEYTVRGTSATITKFYSKNGYKELVIPSTLEGRNVVAIGGLRPTPVFQDSTGLTSVTIPDTVTLIGGFSFQNCTALSSINIPASVTEIGLAAFRGCTSLKSIALPAGLAKIGSSAFVGSGLTSISIGGNVINIGEGAFSGCSSLAAINVDGGNAKYSSVDGVLFLNSPKTLMQYPPAKIASSYSMPGDVTNIASSAFEACLGLTQVTMSDSVTTIGRDVFKDCVNLTTLYIGSGIEAGQGSGFFRDGLENCPKLHDINVDANNAVYMSVDGVVFNKPYIPQATIFKYPQGKEETSYTIPSSVSLISYSAFADCSALTTVVLPNGIKTIKDYAFKGCTGLTSMNIPASLDYEFADGAFAGCSALETFTVDSGNTKYSSEDGVLFNKDKTALKQYPGGKEGPYTIPSTVTVFQRYAFEGCVALTKVNIPSSVTDIRYYAFLDCAALTEINVDPGNPNYASRDGVLYNKTITSLIKCPSALAGEYTVPDGVTSIGVDPSSVTPTRTTYAFENCTGLTSIILPEGLQTIALSSFENCTGLTTITFPASITTIGQAAFKSCSNLEDVYFMGDAPILNPTNDGTTVFNDNAAGRTIYYLNEKTGYTNPWYGYPTMEYGMEAVNITFDANGGTGGAGPTSMQTGAQLIAPEVEKEGYVLGGWLPILPATVPAEDTVYVAQWVKTAVDVTKTENGMVVNIQGWTANSQYQIWSYQQVTSDDLLDVTPDAQENQWILAMPYASGEAGDLQGDGSISFTVPNFTSSTANYVMAVRIADANNNFVEEIRDAYTPEDVEEVVITKVLVDDVVTTGYELREITPGAQAKITVIGNNVPNILYTVKSTSGPMGVELTPSTPNANEFVWDISELPPGLYTIEVAATNGDTRATQLLTFELYTLVAGTDYGVINSMQMTPFTGGVNIAPDYANGTFSFRVREPGRTPIFRSVEYSSMDTIAHPITDPGIYHVYGYVTRAGLIGTETGGFDDGMIRTLVIPRTGQGSGPVTMAFTADQALPDVPKHTPIVFTARATGLPDTVEYSFWRYDATGYVLIKDWSSDNTLSWTPARIGEYSLEARAKGVGAGSYEISRSLTVNITGPESKADITAITLNTTELGAARAKQPIMLKANATSLNGEDLLYKFYVYDEDMRNSQLKGYSVDQHCVWTPRKAGMTYKISVLVKNQTSFGKYDAIESFEVTVD